MIRRNIDNSTGIINGAVGTVKLVTLSIDNKYRIEKITKELSLWKFCTIEPISVKFEIMDNVYVIRKQFPICLSYAMTKHK